MKNKASHPTDAVELRKQAEEALAEQSAAQSPEQFEPLSPKAMRQTLHELRVHQIELEMQNEDLRRTQAELDATRARYFDLYDLAPVSYVTISEKGLFLEANLTVTSLLGVARSELVMKPIWQFILKEDQDIYYLHSKELFETRTQRVCELRMVKKDKTIFWARMEATVARNLDNTLLCRAVISDISVRKQHERLRSLSAEVLGILNNPQALPDVAQGILTAIKRETGFDAVNLRLRQDGDFQYRGADGFSKSFLQAENSLAVRVPDEGICLDENGKVRLECACGLVFPGQADLDNPLRVLGESVWTNDAQLFPRVQDNPNQRLNSCNRCIQEGFQSVALIPVRARQEIIGLFQVNDRRKNCFDLEMIRFFEGIAASFGIALQRQRKEQVLRESQSNLSSLFDAISESVFLMDTEGIVLAANATFAERLGKRPEECVGNSVYSLIPSEASAQRREWVAEVIRTHKPVVYEDERAGRFLRHSVCPVQSMDNPVKRVVVFAIDVTDLKKAEQALRQSEEEFRTMFELASVGMAQADINTGQMLRVNQQMCATTGYSLEEMLSLRIRDFTHPEDQQRDWDMFQKVIRGEIPHYHIEKRYVRKNGAVTWVNVNSTAIRDAAGHPLRTIATIEDITQRKQVEQELNESRELLSLFMRHSPIYAFIKEVTPTESRVLLASENFRN